LAYHHGAKRLHVPAANQEHAPLPTAALRLNTLYRHLWVCQRHAICYASGSDPKRQLPHLSYLLQSAPGAHTRHGWAQLWAARVEAAQTPLLLSSRDGRLLRPVPPEARLAPAALHAALARAAGGRLAADTRDMLCDAWERGARQKACRAALPPCHGLRFGGREPERSRGACVTSLPPLAAGLPTLVIMHASQGCGRHGPQSRACALQRTSPALSRASCA